MERNWQTDGPNASLWPRVVKFKSLVASTQEDSLTLSYLKSKLCLWRLCVFVGETVPMTSAVSEFGGVSVLLSHNVKQKNNLQPHSCKYLCFVTSIYWIFWLSRFKDLSLTFSIGSTSYYKNIPVRMRAPLLQSWTVKMSGSVGFKSQH